MGLILVLVAFGLFVAGIVELFRGEFILAGAFFVLACIVGPGGYSLFK
jgi:hypothetical protein